MFPSYLWSDPTFHAHRLAYWYVVTSLTQPDALVQEETDAAEADAEAYYEIYSDY